MKQVETSSSKPKQIFARKPEIKQKNHILYLKCIYLGVHDVILHIASSAMKLFGKKCVPLKGILLQVVAQCYVTLHSLVLHGVELHRMLCNMTFNCIERKCVQLHDLELREALLYISICMARSSMMMLIHGNIPVV